MALYVVETIHTFCLMNDKICWKLIPQSLLYTPARNRKYLNKCKCDKSMHRLRHCERFNNICTVFMQLRIKRPYMPQLLNSHGLCEVTRTVDIASSPDGQVVGEELHGDNSKDSLKGVHTPGHLEGVLPPLHGLGVPLFYNQDWLSVPCSHLAKASSYLKVLGKPSFLKKCNIC